MNWLLSGWRRWLVAASACGATVAAAFSVPVNSPEATAAIHRVPLAQISAEMAALAAKKEPGDLPASRRWGDFRPEPRKTATLAAVDRSSVPTINPKLLKMNYVGLIAVQGQRTVLLKVPGIGIVRYVAGDTLPDGRVLVSVTDRSLSLKARGFPAEELMLFPSGRNEPQRRGGTEHHKNGAEILR